jgi:uncharacterized protein (PEP-CTERM system associated)
MAGMANTASSSFRLALLACLLSGSAWASDWKFTPGISLSERYSDNVRLVSDNQAESDWITEITPRIGVRRDGARLKAYVDYSLQGLLYANGTEDNKVRHNLNGRANAELLEDWFFLDATARLSHEPRTFGSAVGVGDGVGIGNTTSVGAYTLSPYMKHRFGSTATLEARLTVDQVFIGDSAASNSNGTRVQLNATSGNDFQPLNWSASFSKTDRENRTATSSDSESASLNARYALSRKFGLRAQAGMEKNNFVGASNAVRDYSYYGLGAYYTPSRWFSADALYNYSDNGNFASGSVTFEPTVRTNLNAATSRRAFGRSSSLNLSHRTRFTTWNLRYQDDLTTSQQQFANYDGVFVLYSCQGKPTVLAWGEAPPDASCVPLALNRPPALDLLDQVYVSKSLLGSVSYALRRNTWNLNLYNTQREFQNSGKTDKTQGLQASWIFKPAARTTYTLTGGMSTTESDIGVQSDLWNLSLLVSYQFQPKVTGTLEVRHQERNSDTASSDYTENAVAARLNMSF